MYSDWRGPPMPAQFQLRVAVLVGAALVIFTVIFLRLWYLEVLSGEQYLAEAQNNQVREFTVQAPRGAVLDRAGEELVTNRTALELQVKVNELPHSGERRRRLYERLGELIGRDPERLRETVRKENRELPSSPVTLQRDVAYDTVYYLRENQGRFPGVSVERVYVRQYPQGDLAAHLLGYVREVDPEELEDPRYETLDPGDYVGKDGVEYAYDSLLRGVNGATRVQVDARGAPSGRRLTERDPRPGNDLVLTLDSGVQAAGQAALASFGLPGGFVAMNIRNGELLGVGSNPSYDPTLLGRPTVPPAVAEQIFGDPDDPVSSVAAPAVNRATQAAYPTGSTFKPITAVAGLDSGALSLRRVINDGGSITVGTQEFQNAGGVAHGPVNLRQALQVSSDVFFYTLGLEMNVDDGDGGALQEWAQRLGIGEPTGIDVGNEAAGRLPTPAYRDQHYVQNTSPDSPCGEEVCIEEGEITDRPWSVGDNVNLAVGQGDLQANPLQMAVAYAAIANGGDIVRPHVGMRVEDAAGRVVQEIQPAPRRHVDVDPGWRQTIMEGLRDAAMAPGGTSYPVFCGYPVEIAGKTGTAERPPHEDQSWYVAVAPYENPKYVVAVTVEEGGFGADRAAPASLRILNELLNVNESKIKSCAGNADTYE
jgi:penicillin-binding protein 2